MHTRVQLVRERLLEVLGAAVYISGPGAGERDKRAYAVCWSSITVLMQFSPHASRFRFMALASEWSTPLSLNLLIFRRLFHPHSHQGQGRIKARQLPRAMEEGET